LAEHDDAQKTEQPTQRRLDRGREKGQVALSQEVKSWAALATAALVVAVATPIAVGLLLPTLTRFLAEPETVSIQSEGLRQAALDVALPSMAALAPIALPIAAAVICAGLMQVGVMLAPDKIMPKLSNLSPLKGLQRMVSLPAVIELLKGLVKLAVVSAIVAAVTLPLVREVEVLPGVTLPGLVQRVHDLLIALLFATAVVMTAVAALDYGFQRMTFLKQMRMTRQEVRDEHKDSEGDPQVKARIRRIRIERARRRMMAAVPKATVVITNPTHYAVALLYDKQTMPAPKVVAKGTDAVAQRIRALAEASDVPIVENPPLARSLHASVDIDAEIPPQHYQAVAQVISYLVKRGRLSGARST
jgi:flagellar biosynthetic protein FlhB